MKQYLLDTAILAGYIHNRPNIVAKVTPWIKRQEVATSIFVYGEVLEYLKGLKKFEVYHKQLRQLLQIIYPYFVTYAIMNRYADIRRALRPPHGKGLVGDVDTLIAATALERKLTVVTMDKDFLRIPNLKVILIKD